MKSLRDALIELSIPLPKTPVEEQLKAIKKTIPTVREVANRGSSDWSILVKGKTFENKEDLKDLGGYWSPLQKAWRLDNVNEDIVQVVKGFAGCWHEDA